jgi:hypothetical protein
MIYTIYLTAIGLTPGGSSTARIYTNNTQNTENGTYITIRKLSIFSLHNRSEEYSIWISRSTAD